MKVLVAGAMRSGSTSYTNDLVKSGYKRASLFRVLDGHENEEQLVDEKALAFLSPLDGLVFQTHMRAIGRNPILLAEYGIKVHVLYRGIRDSLWSWLKVTDYDSAWGMKPHGSILIPGWWLEADINRKSWWVIFNVLPWYMLFYASWRDAEIDKTFIRYEEYFKEPKVGMYGFTHEQDAAIGRALDNYGIGELDDR